MDRWGRLSLFIFGVALAICLNGLQSSAHDAVNNSFESHQQSGSHHSFGFHQQSGSHNSFESHQQSASQHSFASHQNLLAGNALCQGSRYKDVCMGSLGSLGSQTVGSVTDPKALVSATIQSAVKHVAASFHFSRRLASNLTGTHKMWMEDCQTLMESAVEEVQTSLSTVGMPNIKSMQDDLLNWLSAVLSYQDQCLDGVYDSSLRKRLLTGGGLTNANQYTSSALAVVTTISHLFKAKLPPSFSVSHQSPPCQGQDISSTPQGNIENATASTAGYGFPPWMPPTVRRLLQAKAPTPTPDAVVAKDGSGQFKTIADALAAYPKTKPSRYVIYVKAGVYDEYLIVTKQQPNVFLFGDGPRKTIITGRKNFHEGVSTFRTATFSAVGEGFVARGIGFQNTAGPEGHQAVALRVQSDKSAFYNCRMDGYQDTLYVQTHRQFYRNCVISGTVDFIFGDAAAVLQNCRIIVRKPGPGQKNAVTAQGRVDKYQTTGIVIQNSRIVAEQKLEADRLTIPTYLGRPWKEFSRTVIMESNIGDVIQPAGWMEWNGNFALDTLFYAEYNNKGPGAATDKRVQWKGYKVITNPAEASQFTAGPFLQGDTWLPQTGTPHFLGLIKAKTK